MPRASDGSYSLPSGSLVAVGEDIVPSQHNPPLQDMAQALTGSLSRDGSGGMRAPFNGGGFRATNLAPGIQPTDAATMAQLGGMSGAPVGGMMDWPAAIAPTGWLICAGQTLSRTDYADLFAVVGTTFGAPSGSTFNLPDLRGRVSAGLDVDSGGYADRLTTPNSRTIGASGGTQTVTLTVGQMPSHTHTGSTSSAGAHTHNVGVGIGPGSGEVARIADSSSSVVPTSSAGTHTHTMNLNNTGSGEAHANVQPTIILNKIIKASNS